MLTAGAPIHVFTDGSYSSKTSPRGWGWLVATPELHLTPARVVVLTNCTGGPSLSTLMESTAIVDAIAEFAPRGRKIVVHADNQALAGYVARYRAGEVGTEFFLARPNVITFEDGLRLLALMATVDFEIVWVKGHSKSFENLVIDEALRIAVLEGQGEAAGCAFVVTALAAGEAIIWSKMAPASPTDASGWRSGHKRVAREHFAV